MSGSLEAEENLLLALNAVVPIGIYPEDEQDNVLDSN